MPRDYDVFAGVDVDHHSIAATFTDHGRLLRSLRLPYSAEQLLNYVRKHFSGQRLAFAYEAGPTGFELYDELVAAGEQFGRFSEVPGELGDLADVSLDGAWRPVADLQVLGHALTKSSHEKLLSKRRMFVWSQTGRDKLQRQESANSFSVTSFSTGLNTTGILSGFRISFHVIPQFNESTGFEVAAFSCFPSA